MLMKRVFGLGLVIAALLGGLMGCCKDPQEFHYPIPEPVQALSPYHFSSVFYLRNTESQLVRMEVVSENRGDYQQQTCSSCCATEYKDESTIFFQDDSLGLNATISISQTGEKGQPAPTRFAVSIGTNGVFYADFEADGSCIGQEGMTCRDSLEVAGRMYYDVMEFSNRSSSRGPDFPEKLYFCPSDGILGWTNYGGGGWDLVH